ncbi:MAG TPA: hypothetical protein VHZ75_03495 [Solirubrobacteraceae bacterium]|jgi:hypothetical protein|nr:hypothetical protein [Solirubrobacteraceae bacterium]
MTTLTPTEDFCPELARSIALALAAYGPTQRLALDYAERGDGAALELLHEVARSIGLELIAFARTTDLIGAFAAGDDPAPVLPLVRVLGESLVILLLITDQQTALRMPMASIDAVDMRYDAGARVWLSRFIDELPERIEESQDGN